jgi:hypothetical protein
VSIPILKKKKHKNILGDIILRQRAKGDNGDMVKVEITRAESILGPGIKLIVSVYSQVKPGAIKRGERFFYKADAGERVAKMAEVLGGHLAELCCAEHGDIFDPDDYAKAAREAFRQVLMKLEKESVLTPGIIKA